MGKKRRRWFSKKTILLILFGMLTGAGALYGTYWSLHYTSTTEFCVSCHSMETPHEEWQASAHFSNPSGVQAECKDCHIPHDSDWAFFKAKVYHGTKDVYKEFITKEIPDREAFDAKRGEMAKAVWAEMKETDSATCRSCHNTEVWDIYAQKDAAQEGHQKMEEEGLTCIDCHRGIAHFPPDFSGEANQAAGKLNDLAKQTPSDAKVLYPINEVEIYAEASKENVTGRILPTAKLSVEQTQDNMRQVLLEGYQQEGAEQVIYALNGKRIISAVVDESALANIEPQGDYKLDENSGSNWRPVNFKAWMPMENLLADAEPLWQYGEEINNAYCGGCHRVVHADHFTANQWPSVVNGMASRTSISDEAKLILTYYLQFHAKDIPGG